MKSTEFDKLEQRLHTRVGRAISDFELIEDGDRILVCLSGGKDSYTLLAILEHLRERAPISFELVAFHLDQKQPGYPAGIMASHLEESGFEYRIQEEDTFSIVTEKIAPDATPCSLCSRLRRGIIYKHAEELRCNKIALGHHRDDSVETLLLNMFHSGQLQGMPAIYTTNNKKFDVIRPLIYVAESDIESFAQERGFPIIPCNLCGSIQGRRKFVKQMLNDLEDTIPHIRNSVLASMQNVRTTHLLDPALLEDSTNPEEFETGDLF